MDPTEVSRNILMYFILPLWLAAGFADYLCHRASGIEHTGPKESVLHLLQFMEMAVPVLAALFLEINALVILTPPGEAFRPEHTNPPGGLEQYFKDNVIGGPGAFTVVAESHEALERALTKKLIQEIAGLSGRRFAVVE